MSLAEGPLRRGFLGGITVVVGNGWANNNAHSVLAEISEPYLHPEFKTQAQVSIHLNGFF